MRIELITEIMAYPELANPFIRDGLVATRTLVIIITLYLAIKVARGIKDSGFLSSVTGMTLYILGNASFQFQTSVMILYPDDPLTISMYFPLSVFYLACMGAFSIFYELESKRYFPERKSLNHYKLSIYALVIFIAAILISLINRNFISFGFIFMVILFIVSTGKSMDNFKNLEFIKRQRPDRYFILGLCLSGFTNFGYNLPGFEVIMAFVLGAIYTIGILMLVKAWSIIPPLKELKWYQSLDKLMVIQKPSSLLMYSYMFYNTPTQILESECLSEQNQDVLTGGALTGIQSLLKEILKSKEGINLIEHGDRLIYFAHSEFATFVLFTKGKSQEFEERLYQFKSRFIQKYKKELESWNCDITVFNGADEIMKEVFLNR